MIPEREGRMISKLNQLKLEGVSKAYKTIISKKNRDIEEEVPFFFFNESKEENNFENLLNNCVAIEKQRNFAKKIITKEEIKKLENVTDFEEIKQIIGEEKLSIIDEKDIKKFFINGTSIFDSKLFLIYLENVSNTQEAILDIIKIDPHMMSTLTSDTLEQFIEEFIPKTKSLKILVGESEWFKEYYIQYVVSIFQFHFGSFCNPENMDARLLFASQYFSNLVNIDRGNEANEFNIAKATSVYNIYAENLDPENDGMMTKDQLKVMCGSNFTDAFLGRLFEVLPTYDGMFDYSMFINFYVAFQNMDSRAGVRYFFKALDIDEDSYISRNDALYFYKGLIDETLFTDINEDRYFSELYDMVSGDPIKGITERQLYKTGSITFIKKLIDINCFKEWENIYD